MKKTLICLTVAAFAAVTSLQAGEQCAAEKTACSAEAKASCSATKEVALTTSCSATKEVAASKSCCASTAGKVAKISKKREIVKGAVVLARR